MITLYNLFLGCLLILASPIILILALFNPRIRYRLKDRFIPSFSIKDKEYILLHAASLGEAKAIKKLAPTLEQISGKKVIFSVFTDTAYRFLKNEKVFLIPVDLCPLYRRIFKTPPHAAFFFETELWPSYIHTLKKSGSRLILLNARLSERSFKRYKNFSFIFRKTLQMFDLIVSKSDQDRERFEKLGVKAVTCGNIKLFRASKTLKEYEKEQLKNRFMINTTKPILTLGSVHKEEMDLVLNIALKFSEMFFIIVAPRHMEDVELFHKNLKRMQLSIVKMTQNKESKGILLLDTIGELEDIYAISDIAVVGGSFNNNLKGHNPVEPLIYGVFTITGPYTESFQHEVEELKSYGTLKQVRNQKELAEIIENFAKHPQKPNTQNYFKKFKSILDCYIEHINKIL